MRSISFTRSAETPIIRATVFTLGIGVSITTAISEPPSCLQITTSLVPRQGELTAPLDIRVAVDSVAAWRWPPPEVDQGCRRTPRGRNGVRGEQFDQLFEIRDNLVTVPHRNHRFSPRSEPDSSGAYPAGCAFAIKGRTHSWDYADCGYPLKAHMDRSIDPRFDANATRRGRAFELRNAFETW
jgi:hypothetical protein